MFRQVSRQRQTLPILACVFVHAGMTQPAPARPALGVAPPSQPDDSASVKSAKTPDDSRDAGPECDHIKRREQYFAEAERSLQETKAIPEWVRDAIWYYINVPLFRNGEPANDSPGTPTWGVKRSEVGLPRQDSLYGGDLQGVRQKLPYLKQLGVNALILDGVFVTDVPLDGRDRGLDALLETLHVKDSVAVAGSMRRVSGETVDRYTWKFTESDRLFLRVLSEAQQQGFRVVVQYPHPAGGGHGGSPLFFYDYTDFIWDMNNRWLRKGTELGDTTGIDGWADANVYSGVQNVFATWRRRIKQVNPDCVLVGLNQLIREEEALKTVVHADALVYTQPGETIVHFFHHDSSFAPSAFLDGIETMRKRWHECVRVGSLDPRLINCLCYREGQYGNPARVEADQIMSPDAIDRWRLAIVFHLLYSLDYALPFGEEVGLIHEGPPWYPEPMWWTDLSNPESKKPYRSDFYALIQCMNALRCQFAPLRRGEFKPMLADDQGKLLVFSRSLPGNDVIVAMNCGEVKQQVKLKVGTPEQPVDLLTPQLEPLLSNHDGHPELHVDTERRLLSPEGGINFWVDPKGVRLVVLSR